MELFHILSGNCRMSKNVKHRSHNRSRRKPYREPYRRVLIICEGETEVEYFNALCVDLGLHRRNTAKARKSDLGTDPENIVTDAKNCSENFDDVYCVFDRDTHATYQQAMNIRCPKNVTRIVSIPCFEIWLLFHFCQSTAPLSAKEAEKRLKQHLPDYQKGGGNAYAHTKTKLDYAVKNAEQVVAAQRAVKARNPTTYVHNLVKDLRKIRDQMADGAVKSSSA